MAGHRFPYNVNDIVEIKVTAGRLAGRWIPARVTRVQKHWQWLDLEIPNNRAYKVFRYAVQVPIKSVRWPKYRFQEGDRICTKIIRGRKQGVWIPARILRVNVDRTYDLCVEDYKKLQVTKFAFYVPEKYLAPVKKSIMDNPLKPKVLMPTNIRELEAKESLKAKEDWEQSGMQERRFEYMENVTSRRSKPRNNSVDVLKPSHLGSGKKAEDYVKDLIARNLKPHALRRHQTTEPYNTKRNAGGGAFKMNNTLVWSSPNSPQDNIDVPCPNLLVHKPEKNEIESPNLDGLFDSNEAPLRLISTNEENEKMTSGKQREEEIPAADDVNSLSDWDEYYESGASECEDLKDKDDSESVIDDEDWGEMHTHRTMGTELTSSPNNPDYSSVTTPGQSNPSWGYPDLCHSQSDPLSGSSKLSYSRGPKLDSERASYDFVDSFLPRGIRKSHGSSGLDRIVTIGVSKHRVQFSEYDFDTPVENIAAWLAEGALKSKGLKSLGLVNNIAYNGKMIPIRSSSGNFGEDYPDEKRDREYSLRDILGKSLDASRQGLAFFVGPVNGRMSYKMSVLDVDKIYRAKVESGHSEIKGDEETFAPKTLTDTGFCEEV